MRLSILILNFVLCLRAVVASWSKEDQEIFRLRDEVEASEGVGVTFYDFLGTKPSANQDEINKAYRKISKVLHPDKVKKKFIDERSPSKKLSQAEIKAAAKAASDRFARLGIVANILRGPGRDRYNHFLSYGFPKWKGTGYYYARFRPGLGSVLTGLFIFFGGGGHWIALYLSWRRQQDFVNRYITFARHAAWGDNIPGLDTNMLRTSPLGSDHVEVQPMNRRNRRMQDRDNKKDKKPKATKMTKASSAASQESTGPRKRVQAENGKILIVDSEGNVYLEQTNEDGEIQEFLLHPDELVKPTMRDTALFRLPFWIYNSISDRVLRSMPPISSDDFEVKDEASAANSSSSENFEVLEKVQKTAPNGTSRTASKKKSRKVK
ncbi:hypothetical protein K3495_g5682 [Podosphaera aphanis]|nr:hypothetical protein K3495_g5682 [Podosphaera aphanis]